MSLLDPTAQHQLIRAIFNHPNPLAHSTLDCVSGTLTGPKIHFVIPSLYWILESITLVTNDTAFLSVTIGGRNVSDWMDMLALDWQSPEHISDADKDHKYLADYGSEPTALLSCSPSYLHIVPALQAQNVYMMRSLANFRQEQGNFDETSRLRTLAKQVAMVTTHQLWNDNWHSMEIGRVDAANMSYHQQRVKSILDGAYVSHGMLQDLRPNIKRKMADIIADRWAARGASKSSDGALALQALSLLDNKFDRFLNLLDQIEVLDPRHRRCGAWDGGPAFAEMIIRSLFGLRFRLGGDASLLLPNVPRTIDGRLLNIRGGSIGWMGVCTSENGLVFC
jgi:hypothetical protein